MSKKKEPAMSEFKVGDWVKRTDKITESIYQISSIDKDLIKCNFIKNGENWRLHTTKGEIEYATPEEIAAGHRIDKPSNPRELETLDHEENHISPNCKVGMFEMDKPITFSEWLGTQGNMVLLHANCCRIAYEAGQQSQQSKVEELQKRLYGALKETQYALQYVEGDMRGNHEFLQMAMIRTFKALEQALKGEGL